MEGHISLGAHEQDQDFHGRAACRRAVATVGSFYDIPHPDVFVHLRNATQELASSVLQQDILLTNVVSIS